MISCAYPKVGGSPLACSLWAKEDPIFRDLVRSMASVQGESRGWISWVGACLGFEVSLALAVWEKDDWHLPLKHRLSDSLQALRQIFDVTIQLWYKKGFCQNRTALRQTLSSYYSKKRLSCSGRMVCNRRHCSMPHTFTSWTTTWLLRASWPLHFSPKGFVLSLKIALLPGSWKG